MKNNSKQTTFFSEDKDTAAINRSDGKKIKQNNINTLLKLNKPLIIFDLEATGLSINIDKVIEIAYNKIFPDGSVFKDVKRINPGIKIPQEAIEIHGITDKDVKNCPLFQKVADELWGVFEDSDYGGFNITGFDLPLLAKEFKEAGRNFNYHKNRVVDSKVIFHYMEPRDLAAALKFYCDKEHQDAHSAMADVEATVNVLEEQLKKYPSAGEWDFLEKIHAEKADRFVDPDKRFYWRDGAAHFNFSKHKDRELKEIVLEDSGFLEWILGADFGEEVKEIVRGALQGKFPKKS